MLHHLFGIVHRLLLLALFLTISIAPLLAQPVTVEWLSKNTCDKEMQTLAFLSTDAQNSYLLRGKALPGFPGAWQPYIASLDQTGKERSCNLIAGFGADMIFQRTVVQGNMLYILSSDKRENWVVRQYDFKQESWVGEAVSLGKARVKTTSYLSDCFFGLQQSEDGSKTCAYLICAEAGVWQTNVLVFDDQFKTAWSAHFPLPKQEGGQLPQQLICSNAGDVFLRTFTLGTGAQFRATESAGAQGVQWRDGAPVYHHVQFPEGGLNQASNAIFMMGEKEKEWTAFYPKQIFKYTASFDMSEDPGGNIIAMGLGGNDAFDKIDAYFFYQIDAKSKKGEILNSANVPVSFRKAFMDERAASQKKPAENIVIGKMNWNTAGNLWVLAEQAVLSGANARVENAALLRIDSTWRINRATPVEKFHSIDLSRTGSKATVVVCVSNNAGWWMFWNKGSSRYVELMLTPDKGKERFVLSSSNESGVIFQPHTFYRTGNDTFFVGESSDGRIYRLGRLTKEKK